MTCEECVQLQKKETSARTSYFTQIQANRDSSVSKVQAKAKAKAIESDLARALDEAGAQVRVHLGREHSADGDRVNQRDVIMLAREGRVEPQCVSRSVSVFAYSVEIGQILIGLSSKRAATASSPMLHKLRRRLVSDICGFANCLYLLEKTNSFPSGSRKIARVPQTSFFGSAENFTPLAFMASAVANTSSQRKVTG